MDMNDIFDDYFCTTTHGNAVVPELSISPSTEDFEGFDFSSLNVDQKIDSNCGSDFDAIDFVNSLSDDDETHPLPEIDGWQVVGDEDAEIDRKIYDLFPMDALKKPRSEFGQWRKSYKVSGVRSLTPKETKRLAAIRRVVLARVYAEKARIKKGRETDSMKERLTKLQGENQALRGRVQNLEHILADLQNTFAKAHHQR